MRILHRSEPAHQAAGPARVFWEQQPEGQILPCACLGRGAEVSLAWKELLLGKPHSGNSRPPAMGTMLLQLAGFQFRPRTWPHNVAWVDSRVRMAGPTNQTGPCQSVG